jgi:undecaprenyl-diphosphatase
MSINHQLFLALANLAHHNDIFDFVVQFFAIYFPYLVIVGAVLFIIYHHHGTENTPIFQNVKNHFREFVILIVAIGLTWGLVTLLKELIASPRPYLVFENFASLFPYGAYDSFPSGHAGLFGAIAGAICIFHKRAGYMFLSCAVLIGFARIIAGVHFPIDIFVGLIIGFFGVQLAHIFLKK